MARFERSGARDAETTQGQGLVFIGTGLRVEALQAAVADCLMADGETLPPGDPFPAWDTFGIEETCEDEHLEPVPQT